MEFGRGLTILVLGLLAILVIPSSPAHAAPSLVSVARVSGGTGQCGTGGGAPACSITTGDLTILDQSSGFGYSVSYAQPDGSAAATDDPWNSANAPTPGTDSGNSQYRFVIQEPAGRKPYIVLGGGNSITWSYSSSTGRITITGTTIRAHMSSASIDLTGFGFFVVDQLMATPVNGGNMDGFTGVTVETNAETFSFSLQSPNEWKLNVTGRTGTTGFWNAFIPQSVLTLLGASSSGISLAKDGTSVSVSPTLVSGKVSIDGTDYPGYTLSLPSISYSTHTFDTKVSQSPKAKTDTLNARLSDGVDGAAFARTISGAWGSSADAVTQRINAGIAVANQLYPQTLGQPFAVLASGGNIMPGHGGYIQVVFDGTVNMVFMITYGPDGKIGAILQYSDPKGTSSSYSPSTPTFSPRPPIAVSSVNASTRDRTSLVFHYEGVKGVDGNLVYVLKVLEPQSSARQDLSTPAQSQPVASFMPVALVATIVAGCIALFYSRRR